MTSTIRSSKNIILLFLLILSCGARAAEQSFQLSIAAARSCTVGEGESLLRIRGPYRVAPSHLTVGGAGELDRSNNFEGPTSPSSSQASSSGVGNRSLAAACGAALRQSVTALYNVTLADESSFQNFTPPSCHAPELPPMYSSLPSILPPSYESVATTTLMQAAAVGDETAMGDCLSHISRLALIKARSDDGKTVLHYAAEHNKYTFILQISSYCMEYWSKFVNAKDKQGRTALHIAAANGSGEAVSMLMMLGAKKDYCDLAHKTAFNYAQALYRSKNLPVPVWAHELRE